MDDNYNTRKLPLVNAPGKYALVDADYDGELFGYMKWRLLPNGYAQAALRPIGDRQAFRYLHRMAYGESLIPDGWWVINVNGNKLDCRTRNLACMPPGEAVRTRRPQSVRKTSQTRNKSGYRGVVIFYNSIYVGLRGNYLRNPDNTIQRFASLEEAARAYDEAARALWGDKAVLNFPPGGRKEPVMPEAHYSPIDKAGNKYGPTPTPTKAKGVTPGEKRELEMHLEALAAVMANAFGGSMSDLEKEDLAAIKRTQKAIEGIMERRQ